MSIIWNMGKIADRQCNQSGYVCSPDYIEQCRRFSSLTWWWWSFAFDCVQTHKEHIEGIDDDNNSTSPLFALIDRYYNEHVNENRMRYTLNFWQIHNNWNQDHRRALLLSLQFRRICAHFSTFCLSFFLIFNIYWRRLCRGNGKLWVVVEVEVVMGLVGLAPNKANKCST